MVQSMRRVDIKTLYSVKKLQNSFKAIIRYVDMKLCLVINTKEYKFIVKQW